MAEIVKTPNTSQGQPPKEMSMEIRLLLAFLLMGAVMFLTPYFFKSPPPAATKKTPHPAPAATQTVKPAEVPAGAPEAKEAAPAATAPTVPATQQQALPPYLVRTDLYQIAFSNQGGTVRSWLLTKFKGNDDKPLELTNTAAKLSDEPFALYFPGEKPTTDVNKAYYTQTPDPDGLGVTYEFSDGHTSVHKVFRFQKNSYVSQVTAEVSVDGKPIPSMIEWRGGFGDLTVSNPSGAERTVYFNAADDKLVEQAAKAAKNGPVTVSGTYTYAGISDQYFAAVFLPPHSTQVQQVTFSDTVPTALEQKPEAFPGTAVSDGTNHFSLFVGPKDLDLLKSINPKLGEVVNFGWWSFIAKPLFYVVNFINDGFVHNYGWSIVLITVIITFMLFPVKISSMKSMRKMQALKPQIDTINQKYKNIGLRDPRKAEQNQEVMDLYKKHGVNPMGGCLPMLVQLILIYPFYEVLRVAVEMRGAHWLWVTDLSQAEHLPIKILPIIMIATQFFYQKMTPTGNVDPNQQKMMMFMPLIFGFMFYNFPSGLVLYYLTSNLVNMGQQWFFNHTAAAEEAARSVQPPKKKNGRK